MNQALKFKWHSIYGQILFDRKLKAAWEKVEANKGAGALMVKPLTATDIIWRKTLTLSQERWIERVNPVIRGKIQYFHTIYKAIKANEEYGIGSFCFYQAFGKELLAIDGYIRQRLRVAMIHHHPNQRKGHVMKTKWSNEFFARVGLISAYWYYYHKIYGFTLESYIQRMKEKQRKEQDKRIQRAKRNGQEYYTPDRVRKMKYAQRIATY